MKDKLKSGTKILLNIAILITFIILTLNKTLANVTLPRIFSDNMVLQRETNIRIWGWADPNQRVRVNIADQTTVARANRNGEWHVILEPLKPGGPFTLTVRGKNTITFSNVLVGDVWLGSGQSNMEWPVNLSANPDQEIQMANYPEIRLFTVPRHMSTTPQADINSGNWHVCTPENIAQFSAVGYYFARHLHHELNVPIGIINSSWGGTVAETWISLLAIASHPDFKNVMDESTLDLTKAVAEARIKQEEWTQKVNQSDLGLINGWANHSFDHTRWDIMRIPVIWEQAGLPDFDGVVWLRKEFYLDSIPAKGNLIISLGSIDDSDYTFVNGHLVGQTLDQYSAIRKYEVPSEFLKRGKNVIAVRVIDTGGGGGIWGDENRIYYMSGEEKKPLAGFWRYAVGVKMDPPPQLTIGPNSHPTLLFNGMINPITPLAIRGVIWYQGESNTGRAEQYRSLFPLLIEDWRSQFNNQNLPFLFVQLANFMQPNKLPSESQWAELREAQALTLSLPYTGMAVAIDIGEADDIHPRNKQDVGKRLALAAMRVSYGKDIVHSGPVYKSMEIIGNKIRLNFSHIGSGLVAKDKYGYLKGFAIAGEDRVFHWARGVVMDDHVIIYSNAVTKPVAVRYAWGNNPDDANLYNKENLPAGPFRTDNWTMITDR